MFKRLISILSIFVILFSCIPIGNIAFAFNDGQGSGTTGGSGSGTWNINQSGYRIYVVDNKGNRVSNKVIFRFSDTNYENASDLDTLLKKSITGYKERFPSKYNGGKEDEYVLIKENAPTPIKPKGGNGVEANGGAFTTWFWGGSTQVGGGESTGGLGGSNWKPIPPRPQALVDALENKEEAGKEDNIGDGKVEGETEGSNGQPVTGSTSETDSTVHKSEITKPDLSDKESTTIKTNDTVIDSVDRFVTDSGYRNSIYLQNSQYVDSSININSAVIESYKQYLDSKFRENIKVPEKTLTAELVDIYNSLEAQNGKTAAIEMMNNIAGYAEVNYGKYLNEKPSHKTRLFLSDK